MIAPPDPSATISGMVWSPLAVQTGRLMFGLFGQAAKATCDGRAAVSEQEKARMKARRITGDLRGCGPVGERRSRVSGCGEGVRAHPSPVMVRAAMGAGKGNSRSPAPVVLPHETHAPRANRRALAQLEHVDAGGDA